MRDADRNVVGFKENELCVQWAINLNKDGKKAKGLLDGRESCVCYAV